MDETKGKVKEAVGWATGDREVEAEGRVEQATAEPGGPDEVTESAVAKEKDDVREEHGEFDPDHPGEANPR